ncbi:hypothetical protein GCM10009800_47900 [Nocardiopsis rhodophaea]
MRVVEPRSASRRADSESFFRRAKGPPLYKMNQHKQGLRFGVQAPPVPADGIPRAAMVRAAKSRGRRGSGRQAR